MNLSQGGSTLHSPEATEKKASTTSAGVRGKDPQPVVSRQRGKNLAEILSSYRKTQKPKKRLQARPAAKQPLKKKAKLLPGESSESSEFKETEEDEQEEPPSRDDDDEDKTQETQAPDRGAQPRAWLPLKQEDQWGAWRGVPIWKWRPWQLEIPRDILQQKTKLGRAGTVYWVPAYYKSAVWHSVGEYCVAAGSYGNGGGVQKRNGSAVRNRWCASSKCQEEAREGKEAKEEEEDANEELWQAGRRRCRRGKQRAYGREGRGCSTSVRH